jgi:hypothetical protein
VSWLWILLLNPAQVTGALLVIGRTNPALLGIAVAVIPVLSRAVRSVVVRTARLAYRQRNAASDALKFADERLTQASMSSEPTRGRPIIRHSETLTRALILTLEP